MRMNFDFFSFSEKSEKWTAALRWIVIVGIFAVCLAPLIMVSGFFFPFVVPRNIWFRVLVELIGASTLLLVLFGKVAVPRRDRILQAYAAFMVAAAVSCVLGIGPFRSFWGNYERMEGLVHLLHLFVFLAVVRLMITESKLWQALLTWNVVIGMVMALAGWTQYVQFLAAGVDDRVGGTTGNPAYLGGFLAIQLFLLLYFFVFPQRLHTRLAWWSWVGVAAWAALAQVNWKLFGESDWGLLGILKRPTLATVSDLPLVWIAYVVIAIGLGAACYSRRLSVARLTLGAVLVGEAFVLLYTQTRGAFLGVYVAGLLLSGLVAWWLRGSSLQRRIGQMAFGGLLAVPVMLLILRLVVPVGSIPLVDRLTSFSLTDITTESRLLTWQASWRGWTDSPRHFVFGYGLEQYGHAFNRHFPVKIFRDPGSQIWFDHAHNMFFDTAVTTGLVGVVCLGWFFVMAFRAGGAGVRKRELTGELILLAGVTGYLTQNFFVFDTINTQISLLVLISGLAVADGVRVPESFSFSPNINLFRWLAGATTVAGCILIVAAVNVRTAYANRELLSAITVSRVAGGEQAAVNHFLESIRVSWGGRWEARDQFASFAQQLVVNGRPQAKGVATAAIVQLNESIAEEPKNARHYLILGQLRNDYALVDASSPQQAIRILQQGIALSPNRPQLWFALGRAYIQAGQAEAGVEAYQHAVALAPWVVDSQIQLLSVYAITNQLTLAEVALQEIYRLQAGIPLTPGDVGRLQAVLTRTKQFTMLVGVYQHELQYPTAPVEYVWGLAEAYVGQGKPEEASRLLNEVVRRAPQLKEPAEKVRQQLKLPSS
jgi:tetratricopeptide (TPR) repeat protein